MKYFINTCSNINYNIKAACIQALSLKMHSISQLRRKKSVSSFSSDGNFSYRQSKEIHIRADLNFEKRSAVHASCC